MISNDNNKASTPKPLLSRNNNGSLEINLSDFLVLLWSARRLIISIALPCTLVAILFALFQKDTYRAEAVLTPAEVRQSNSPLVSQLGAAAGLVGINVGEAGGQEVNAMAILQSRQFAKKFISKHNLLPMLMASTWNSDLGGNKIDSDYYDVETGSWINEPPSDWKAFAKFSKILTVEQNRQTGLITVAIDWDDPQQASEWVNWLVSDINEYYKLRDLDEAKNAISYLRAQLEGTQLVEMQRVFYQLIESQTRVVMLADVREEYVFQVVDPAVIPEKPIGPNRLLIILIGIMLSLIFGLLAALIINYRQLKNVNRTSGITN